MVVYIPHRVNSVSRPVKDLTDIIAIDEILIFSAIIIFNQYLPVGVIVVQGIAVGDIIGLSDSSAQGIVGELGFCLTLLCDFHNPSI